MTLSDEKNVLNTGPLILYGLCVLGKYILATDVFVQQGTRGISSTIMNTSGIV